MQMLIDSLKHVPVVEVEDGGPGKSEVRHQSHGLVLVDGAGKTHQFVGANALQGLIGHLRAAIGRACVETGCDHAPPPMIKKNETPGKGKET